MKTTLVHCSYHKCLTVYFSKVLSILYNRAFWFSRGYRHFESLIHEFYLESDHFKISSINNHSLDLGKLGSNFRITRFMRDPRDLVVSGYFYHKRGAEAWCNIINPKEEDWKVVNGSIPANMGEGYSFSSYLQTLSKEEGLMVEIDFRRKHFDSMLQWPISDHRIKLFYYEDVIGNEGEIFAELLSHFGISWLERWVGVILADRFSAKKQSSKTKHIRDPKAGQWEQHFSPKVRNYFEQQYGDLLKRYGYGS